jgi:chromosome segregation ATPase
MKKVIFRHTIGLTAICFLLSFQASAQSQTQSTSALPSSEQSLQELVAEVRRLRTEVQRLSNAVFKGQMMVERFRVQQAEVTRLSHDLSEVRTQLDDTRMREQKLKVVIKALEKEVESGVTNEREMNEMKIELRATTQSQQRLLERESQLLAELDEARIKLSELEKQLNALER